MDYLEFGILFVSGMIGGALNATIGGGWFIVFPTLISKGRAPVGGNIITIITLWFGHISSIKRNDNNSSIERINIKYFFIISLAGGILGALLLVVFSHQTFEHIGPYLLLCSWLIFTFDKNILAYFDSRKKQAFEYSHDKLIPLFLLNVYGSYFGAGIGVMFIALLSFYGLKDDRRINGLKDFMIAVNNGIAILIFVLSGLIYWTFAVALILGSIVGGYYGVAISHKMNMIVVKRVVVFIGALVTLYFLNLLDLNSIL